MTFSNFNQSILFSFALIFSISGCSPSPPPGNPNIILIMTDDLGWGDVGFNGNTVVQTPHLDRLAASGIVFQRFYSASAVCSPTRASVLTGRNPMRVGVPTANSGHLREDEITLAELVREAGYATGHFGKWHLGTLTTTMRDSNRGRPGDSTHFSIPTQHGFDEYFSTEAKVPTYDPMLYPVAFDSIKGESLRYGWAAINKGQAAQNYGTRYFTQPDTSESDNLTGANSKVIMDRVLPFISRSQEASTPFFAVIWFHTPHLPVVADSSYRGLYPTLSHEEQIYFGTITAMDDQVGRLKKHLETLGASENTMIWFASDNGPERETPGSAGPYRERKRSLHEGGVRVPAFVSWPAGINQGAATAVPMVTSDYLPTIAEYLNLSPPEDRVIDGMSLVDVIHGNQTQRSKPIGFFFREKRSWVDNTYKLISKDEGLTYELYNLIEDPAETTDISQEEPGRVEAMKIALDEWISSWENPVSS